MLKTNDFVKKVLLNMKYDSKKTLSENQNIIKEVATGGNVSWTADKAYELDVDWAIGSEYIQKGFKIGPITNKQICYYGNCLDVICPSPQCYVAGVQSKNPLPDAFIPDKGFTLYFMCPEMHKLHNNKGEPMSIDYNGNGIDFFPHGVTNANLKSKLTSVFCVGKVEDTDNTEEIVLTPELLNLMFPKGKQNLPISDTKPTKSQEEINKEILARKDADQIAPRLFVASKGFNNWKKYQDQCCCPSYSENKKEHIQCNKNIAMAVAQGWNPNEGGCPELAKNKYCKGDMSTNQTEFGMEGKGKSLDDEGGIGSDQKLNDEGEKSLIATKEKPFYSGEVGSDGIYDPQFNGGTSKFEDWLSDNLWSQQNLIQKNEMDKISELILKFDVGTDGKLSNFDIEITPVAGKTITNLKNKDKVIDILEKMPNWLPAEKDGVKINSSVEYPIIISY